MAEKFQNATRSPKLFYGLHFVDGPAEYQEPGKEPYRVFLNEKTITDMDQTFQGCPVYVGHVDEVDLSKIQEADGYVIRSFRNDVDGKHWVEFLVVSDKGHQAIQNGWKLSNAYVAESFGPGGLWNGIEYQREITKGKFEHLAIVPDPRYAESIVLDFSQFRDYNETLKLEHARVQNSSDKKEDSRMSIMKFFKKTPIETNQDFEAALITLPSGKDVSLADLVKNAAAQEKDAEKKAMEEKKENSETEEHAEHKASEDKAGDKKSEEETEKQGKKDEEPGAAPQMANMDHHVMVNGESKPLHEVMKQYDNMHRTMSALSAHHATMKNDEQMDGGEKDAKAAQDADCTTRNADEDGGEKEAVAQLKESDKTHRNSQNKENFDKLANAHLQVVQPQRVDQLSQMDRGKSRYGSGTR